MQKKKQKILSKSFIYFQFRCDILGYTKFATGGEKSLEKRHRRGGDTRTKRTREGYQSVPATASWRFMWILVRGCLSRGRYSLCIQDGPDLYRQWHPGNQKMWRIFGPYGKKRYILDNANKQSFHSRPPNRDIKLLNSRDLQTSWAVLRMFILVVCRAIFFI